MVTITVENGSVFYVHQNLLTQVSPYFKNALEKEFREAKERSICLPHVTVAVMEEFIDWLYTEKLHVLDIDGKGKSEKKTLSSMRRSQLIDLYIFGDAQDVPTLRHTTIAALIELHSLGSVGMLCPGKLKEIYSNLPPRSPLIQYLVDLGCRFYLIRAEGDVLYEYQKVTAKYFPVEFLAAFFVRHCYLSHKIKMGLLAPDYDLEPCDYHEHATQQERDECPRKPNVA